MFKFGIQVCILGSLVVSGAMAAETTVKNATAVKARSLSEVWGSRKVDMGVKTSMISGEILGTSFEGFVLVPNLRTKLGRFDSSFELPFIWASVKNRENEAGSRDIGRPIFTFMTEVGGHQIPGLKFEMGESVKLPMLSSSDEFSLLNKAWAIKPIIKMTKGLSGRLDFIGSTELEISRKGKLKSYNGSEIRFERAPAFQITTGLTYRYDQALKIGAMTYLQTAAGRHNLSGQSEGKPRESLSASRDRIAVGVFANYQTIENTQVQLGLRSSLKSEDSLIGALIASESPENSAKLATTLAVSRTF